MCKNVIFVPVNVFVLYTFLQFPIRVTGHCLSIYGKGTVVFVNMNYRIFMCMVRNESYEY
jgi:hypothetical protein